MSEADRLQAELGYSNWLLALAEDLVVGYRAGLVSSGQDILFHALH
jgi:hypothetical protein